MGGLKAFASQHQMGGLKAFASQMRGLKAFASHHQMGGLKASASQMGGLKAFASCSATVNTLEREVYQTSTLGFEPEDTKGRSQKLSLQKHSLVQQNHYSTGHILIRKPRLVIS